MTNINIIICIKQVPATENIKIDPQKGTLIREGAAAQINPFDLHAIECGLSIKERLKNNNIKTIAISMGPAMAKEVLIEALSMGVDQAVLLSDTRFAGADTLATAYTLSCGIKKLAPFKLIICGREAIDGDTGQVGPQIAQFLNIPYVSYVSKIININEETMQVERVIHNGREVLLVNLPALITVLKELNTPRMPTLFATLQAKKKNIFIWTKEDIQAQEEKIGLSGSPTRVVEISTVSYSTTAKLLTGTLEEQVDALIDELKKAAIL